MRYVAHSARVLRIAVGYGWLPAAKYTNLRDVRSYDRLGFLDVDWRSYDFARHLRAAQDTTPVMTVAQDIETEADLGRVLEQASELAEHAEHVAVVPKAMGLAEALEEVIPDRFLLAYSVPTRYGGTSIPVSAFTRPVHLLGGRPDVQRRLGESMNVISLDCNRFTLDAAYGDFFDGSMFRPHPTGGYERCIADSLANINALWADYRGDTDGR